MTLRSLCSAALVALLGLTAAPTQVQAQTVYTTKRVTGYTDDVIADSIGSVISRTTNTVDRGIATVKWCFADSSYVSPTGATARPALSPSGFIRSRTTTGLTFQMASSRANNSLRIDGAGSGTLTLTSPQACTDVWVLATEGNGDTSPKTFTVTFTDGTTQIVPGIIVPDWYSTAMTPAIIVGSRVNRGTTPLDGIETRPDGPIIFEVRLPLLPANYNKLVQRVSVSKPSTDPVLNIMGITLGQVCTLPFGSPMASPTSVCPGQPVQLSFVALGIGSGFSSQWQASTDNGVTWTDIAGATTPTYTVTPLVTTRYRLRAACGTNTLVSITTTVTVTPGVATLSYTRTTFCSTAPSAVPIMTPAGGTFTGTAGLVINPATGAVNLVASTLGAHSVTYTVSTPCPATATAAFTILPGTTTVAYSAPVYCLTGSGTSGAPVAAPAGGTFTSPAGLALNSTTGVIDLAASTAGTYVVSYTSPGQCTATATATVRLVPGVTTLTYGATTFCATAPNALPVTSLSGGTFTGTAGLVVNAATGAVNLAASTLGSHSVTYTSSSPCPATAVATFTILPGTATVAYNAPTFCLSGTTAAPVVNPAGGTFTSPTGLTINSTTGVINLGASLPGTYVVTYTSPGPCPASATATVALVPRVATVAYSATSFCATDPAFTPTVTPAGGTFTGTAGLVINPMTGAVNPTASTLGTHTITYRINDACPATATTTLTILPRVATLAYGSSTYCRTGNSDTPMPTPTGGTFTGPAGLVINRTTGVIDLAASPADSYTITYTSPGQCPATATATILIKSNALPTFPTIITANGDGINDVLRLRIADVTGYRLQVYNRWGRQLWDTTNPTAGWNPENHSGGTYYYQVEYTDCTNTRQFYKGWVDVIK